jgi:hypothetical protein
MPISPAVFAAFFVVFYYAVFKQKWRKGKPSATLFNKQIAYLP